MEEILTKEAKKALAQIYKEYCRRRSSGMEKRQAAFFDNQDKNQCALIDSVRQSREELARAGFLTCYVVGGFLLTDPAIVYMENLPAETVKSWLSFASQFIP